MSADAKRASVWHNFAGTTLDVMRVAARARHATRGFVDAILATWFDARFFEWLDVGIVGMVDYERLRGRLRFRFTGVDMSENVVGDSERYLRGGSDRVLVWDIETPAPTELHGAFDLVTLRHVLNHCEYYEQPLRNAARVLRLDGRVVIVLHLALIEGLDELKRHRNWPVPGEVIGNRYERDRFLKTVQEHFERVQWFRIDDGRKPNDIIIGQRRTPGSPGDARPPRMERFHVSARRRDFLTRIVVRAIIARRAAKT